jgi:hypothetical protein
MEIKFNVGEQVWFGCPAQKGTISEIRIFKKGVLYYIRGIKHGYAIIGRTEKEVKIFYLQKKIEQLTKEIERLQQCLE